MRQIVTVLISFIVLGHSDGWASPFQPERSAIGVQLYTDNQGNYVQAINLSQGAAIRFLFGASSPGTTTAAYGGKSPSFRVQDLQNYWEELQIRDTIRAFSVCNGQFFGGKDAIELAFPVKEDGQWITTGYAGASEFPHEKAMLGIRDQSAEIIPLPEEINLSTNILPYDQAIVGIQVNGGMDSITWYSKAPFELRPRTFLGIADSDRNGTNETILILTTTAQTQLGAAGVLERFGATAVMMLDGGGSTQLMVQGETRLRSADPTPRQIPQAIGVFSGF